MPNYLYRKVWGTDSQFTPIMEPDIYMLPETRPCEGRFPVVTLTGTLNLNRDPVIFFLLVYLNLFEMWDCIPVLQTSRDSFPNNNMKRINAGLALSFVKRLHYWWKIFIALPSDLGQPEEAITVNRMTVIASSGCPKSVRNRCVIERFVEYVCYFYYALSVV